MDLLKRRVMALQTSVIDEDVTQEKLESLGLREVTLRDYQISGVKWLSDAFGTLHQSGCILGDEMGLGKTIQTLSFLLLMKNHISTTDPFLILAPLSVLSNWQSELERWAPSLKLIIYMGDKEAREKKREALDEAPHSAKPCPFDVFLTSYELCLKDSPFLKRFKWSILIVDEAHRLKNYKSLLYQELLEFDIFFKVLLTGTPVQNNLQEIYSLLSFINPNIFKIEEAETFIKYFGGIVTNGEEIDNVNDELRLLLKPFLLRRVKSEVMQELPKKSEVLLFTAMSPVQKKLYKAILTKDYGAFQADGPNKTRLMNVLLQLRKCCNHPYIFPGVEPEPFEIGDHLIEASGKLKLLDKLLAFLNSSGHRVLIFSQFTMMLDIVQDYLTYKGFTYERLDGSVRGEERYLAVNNFNASNETFIFLLSTRAGGQGLNLMTADTVIFLDNDFNPQNDLQAAARAHRIGQTRPVKIIRLISKNTVEEIIFKRAENKLKLTQVVIEGGQFSNFQNICDTPNKLADILKFGLEDLFNDDSSAGLDEDFRSMLGGTIDGEWMLEETEHDDMESEDEERDAENMYVFEGRDYSKATSDNDKSVFDDFVTEAIKEAEFGERTSRRSDTGSLKQLAELPTRKRRELTEEEKLERRRKRAEAAAKRAKIAEEEEIRKAFERKKKRERFWQENGYTTSNIKIELEGSDEESETEDDSYETVDSPLQIDYVVGDVTRPLNTGNKDAVIVHCVDDSGRWGSGGVFSALMNRSSMPKEQYELAGKMKDLALGDAHLVSVDDRIARNIGRDMVALIVAQKRDKHNHLSPIIMSALTLGLERVQREARTRSASVHFPRIGHNTPNFNWYGTERLIKKLFTSKGIPASVYYFPRTLRDTHQDPNSSSPSTFKTPGRKSSNITDLPDIFSGKSFYFHDIDEEKVSQLTRYIIAYDGDVDNFLTHSTAFAITNGSLPEEIQTALSSNAKVVSTDWAENCISKGVLLEP